MILEPSIIIRVEYLARAGLDAFQSRKLTPKDNGARMPRSRKSHEQVSLAAARRAAIADHVRIAFISGGLRAGLRRPDGTSRLRAGLSE